MLPGFILTPSIPWSIASSANLWSKCISAITGIFTFAFIFLSNVSIYTPYSRGGCYIYGLLLGLLTFAFYFIDLNLGLYILCNTSPL